MFANRISQYLPQDEPTAPLIPSGFAVCQLPSLASSPALQMAVQQQAYQQALSTAREEALRTVLGRLHTSLN